MNIPENLKGPIADFINEVDRIPNLKYVILFGSIPKGEVSKKSDIDLLMLFDTDHNPEVGKEMDICLEVSSEISQRYNLAHPFSFVMKSLNDPNDMDTDFLWNISKEGTIIWGKPDTELLKEPGKNLQPKALITYSIKGLASRDKSAIHRGLFGYRFSQRVKGKSYYSQKRGLIDEEEYKLGDGVLLVPSDKEEEILKLLKGNGARYRSIKVWK